MMYCAPEERTLGRPVSDDDLERFDWYVLCEQLPVRGRLVSAVWVRTITTQRPA